MRRIGLRPVVTSLLMASSAFGVVLAQDTSPATSPATSQAAAPKPDFSGPLMVARGFVGTGDYPAGERALRTLLTQVPALADAHYLLGFALLHEGKPSESLAEYTEGAKYREPGPEELTSVGLDYLQLNTYGDAEKWLTAAAKRAPERPLIWYLLGRTQYAEGHGEDAARSLLTCLRLDPHRLRAQYLLGLTYELLKRPTEAETAYRAAIAWQENAAGKDLEPYLDLGTLLRKQGKVKEAIPLLAVAAEGSKDAAAHEELGLAFEDAGRYNDAAGELKAAVALTPAGSSSESAALHFFLGRVDRKGGREDDARREFALAAEQSPKH
jgi:tetratricopeptide (TPR) repeat protein